MACCSVGSIITQRKLGGWRANIGGKPGTAHVKEVCFYTAYYFESQETDQ